MDAQTLACHREKVSSVRKQEGRSILLQIFELLTRQLMLNLVNQ